MNITLLLGALFGLSAVAAGAYANHGVAPEDVKTVMLAVRFQQFHGLAILAAGFALYMDLPSGMAKLLKIAAAVFSLGIMLFAGTIYLSYFAGIKSVGFLVPIGGMTIMAGWLVLVVVALRFQARR